ncbi:hypothetical protein BD414DRAFT_479023 [Trametes punicea]|nr:hypothetical protein BD414DRAFT_479023 [Trametes punicea]
MVLYGPQRSRRVLPGKPDSLAEAQRVQTAVIYDQTRHAIFKVLYLGSISRVSSKDWIRILNGGRGRRGELPPCLPGTSREYTERTSWEVTVRLARM